MQMTDLVVKPASGSPQSPKTYSCSITAQCNNYTSVKLGLSQTSPLQKEDIWARDWTDFGAFYHVKPYLCLTFKGLEYDARRCKDARTTNKCNSKYSTFSDSEVQGCIFSSNYEWFVEEDARIFWMLIQQINVIQMVILNIVHFFYSEVQVCVFFPVIMNDSSES